MSLMSWFKGTPTNRTYTVSDITDATKHTGPLPVTAIGSGQTTAALSTPVVPPTAEQTGLSANALNADLVPSTDVSGYKEGSIQVLGTWSGTLTVQGSNDNTNFVSVSVIPIGIASTVLASNFAANGIYKFGIAYKYLRIRMTSYVSGPATGVLELYGAADHPLAMIATSLQSGTWNVGTLPLTSGGLTPHRTISAASTNATVVKASAGQVYTIHVGNLNAAVRYLKLYNKATAPTVGTDTPVQTYAIPATGVFNIQFSGGLAFATGIGFAITSGIADADTGAVSADEHVVNIGYK